MATELKKLYLDFKQIVQFSPSRNWCQSKKQREATPSGSNYGITTMNIRFILKGELGAVQFLLNTPFASEPVRKHMDYFPPSRNDHRIPEAWDLGYHSLKPHYPEQSKYDCDLFPGSCYYDGSSLNGPPFIEGFLSLGSDWLWEKLHEYYLHVFHDADFPSADFTPLPHPDDRG